MTDEIKMCKWENVENVSVHRGVPDFDEHQWVPLDPQPSCENCGIGAESCYEDGIYCPKLDELFHMCPTVPLDSDFYCKYWEMKK